jgi:AcrR family transcriptional regulator
MVEADRPDVADRILDAAQRLVLQRGARRLSLTDVAKLAGVARPTLYRYFTSKEELVDALGKRERRRFNTVLAEAISDKTETARLDAAMDVVVGFLQNQPPRHLIDLEPGFVNEQMALVLPMIEEALGVVLDRDLAGAVARIALSHYIFPDPNPATARRQLRAAAGLSISPSQTRASSPTTMSVGMMSPNVV